MKPAAAPASISFMWDPDHAQGVSQATYLFNELGDHGPKRTLLGEVNGTGSSETFDAGNTIQVEPYSHTLGTEFFGYEVDYRYYDSNGKLIPMAVPVNEFGRAVPAFARSRVTIGVRSQFSLIYPDPSDSRSVSF